MTGASVQPVIRRVEAAGAVIAVRRFGSGPRLVCLHAIGHAAADYDDLMRRMGGDFELLTLDWPGHGDSPADSQPASAGRYAEILTAFLQTLEGPPPTLIGNSVGGAAAIIAAALRPGRVGALVLCNPGGLQPVNLVTRLYCRAKARFFATGERGDPRFAARFRRYYERSVLTEPAAESRREAIIASAYRSAPALRQGWSSFADAGSDLRRLTPKITCPVLYAWARKDGAVALSRCRRAIDATPKHQLALFEASHSAFLEQPDAFEAALRRFLS